MHNSLLASFDLQPSLIAVEMKGMFEACLSRASSILESIEKAEAPAVMADDFWFDASDWRSVYRPYIVKDGVLLIPIKGVLLHDFGYQLGSWATGYNYIWKAFERGLADGNVKGIALIIDSPGGHVAGNFDLVDKMFAARGDKPIRAFAAESAYSAAYSIASVADKIVVSRTGGVGSIGVVTFHIDISKAMDASGIKITFIHAGKHKVDGNAYEALPDDVKDRIQARIDELYGVFVSTVARNRGMDEQAIRKTEALTFTATQALSNGLADEIGSLEDSTAAFAAELFPETEDDEMSTQDKAAADKAALDTARAEGRTEGEKAGREAGVKEGATAERTRVKAILGSDEAKGREDLASHYAFDTDDAPEKAIAAMAKAPKTDAKGKEPNRLEQAMGQTPNPVIGAGGESGQRDPDDVEGIFASAGYAPRKVA
ncbi:S49 family peptidase [Microvirga zambiensis]|uniref:S49 family peptidase n=1 Tax=Microvirga zambiensis TaxID=1402137 RepID=UPI00191E1C0B|nr:S49 family peptidase [Microvirga zambiensis]